MRESICTQCHVNNLARTESFEVFSPGFSSLINNISNIRQSNFDLHFLKTEKCLSFKSDFDRPWSPSVFQLQNIYARLCVGASVGLCTRHNLCRTDHIEIYRPRTACLQWEASSPSPVLRGEDLADLLRLKDRRDLHSNFCAYKAYSFIVHF